VKRFFDNAGEMFESSAWKKLTKAWNAFFDDFWFGARKGIRPVKN